MKCGSNMQHRNIHSYYGRQWKEDLLLEIGWDIGMGSQCILCLMHWAIGNSWAFILWMCLFCSDSIESCRPSLLMMEPSSHPDVDVLVFYHLGRKRIACEHLHRLDRGLIWINQTRQRNSRRKCGRGGDIGGSRRSNAVRSSLSQFVKQGVCRPKIENFLSISLMFFALEKAALHLVQHELLRNLRAYDLSINGVWALLTVFLNVPYQRSYDFGFVDLCHRPLPVATSSMPWHRQTIESLRKLLPLSENHCGLCCNSQGTWKRCRWWRPHSQN